jgi:uncharacterized protein
VKNNSFIFGVGPLLNSECPRPENHLLACSLKNKEELAGLEFTKPLRGQIKLFKAGKDLTVHFVQLKSQIRVICQRCLAPFDLDLVIQDKYYLYQLEKIEKITDWHDFYFINHKHLTIDLSRPIYQEIIMSVPLSLFCHSQCRGLCDQCGQDLNQKTCECVVFREKQKPNQPLKDLKKLFCNRSLPIFMI